MKFSTSISLGADRLGFGYSIEKRSQIIFGVALPACTVADCGLCAADVETELQFFEFCVTPCSHSTLF